MESAKLNLFSEVRYYLKLSQELKTHLSKYPDDWVKFQKMFNLTVDKIYEDIFQFEKENIDKFEAKVYKLKKIFEKRYRQYFLGGEYIKWSFDKPFGYAGDYKIIETIYKNQPTTTGFDRLWDNYFLQLDASKATRERKEDLKKIILNFVEKNKKDDIRILDLASGPATEIKELLTVNSDKIFSKVNFHCYDFDIRAIDYAKQSLGNYRNVNFFQKNAIRLALKKDIKQEIPQDYDLIYSTGLFDYLDERVAVRLVGNLRRTLKKGGIMVISNYRNKCYNPSAGWMEWVAEWNLIYRSEDEFKKIFLGAGFATDELKIIPQQGGVMQYCFATIK